MKKKLTEKNTIRRRRKRKKKRMLLVVITQVSTQKYGNKVITAMKKETRGRGNSAEEDKEISEGIKTQ